MSVAGAMALMNLMTSRGASEVTGPHTCAECGIVYVDLLAGGSSVFLLICIGGRDTGALPPHCRCREGVAWGVSACYYSAHDRCACLKNMLDGMPELKRMLGDDQPGR